MFQNLSLLSLNAPAKTRPSGEKARALAKERVVLRLISRQSEVRHSSTELSSPALASREPSGE